MRVEFCIDCDPQAARSRKLAPPQPDGARVRKSGAFMMIIKSAGRPSLQRVAVGSPQLCRILSAQ